MAGLGVLVCFTAGAVNINGSGVSLHLTTTDLSSSAAQTNGANARALFAGTPVGGIVSINGAGAKIIIEPMNILAANGSGEVPLAEFTADPLWAPHHSKSVQKTCRPADCIRFFPGRWDFGDGSPTAPTGPEPLV